MHLGRPATRAKFIQLQPLSVIALVLLRSISALFTLIAGQRDYDTCFAFFCHIIIL